MLKKIVQIPVDWLNSRLLSFRFSLSVFSSSLRFQFFLGGLQLLVTACALRSRFQLFSVVALSRRLTANTLW